MTPKLIQHTFIPFIQEEAYLNTSICLLHIYIYILYSYICRHFFSLHIVILYYK